LCEPIDIFVDKRSNDTVANPYVFVTFGASAERVFLNQHEDNYIVEVIGHPIHLEHVLNAIGEEKVGLSNEFELVDSNDWTIRCKYNVSLPFNEQSDDLYKFLLEILV
jgi:hypothetical protein